MNPAGMNRRIIGAVALAVGAVATIGGVLLPLYQEARNFSGRESTLVVTAFGSTGVGASSPGFGVPLVLAALLLLAAAALVFRETPSTPIGRMAAIAGAAVLLGAAWSIYLYVTNQAAIALASVPPGGTLVQTLDIGLVLLGGGWVVGTVGAVLVQDLPEPDTTQDQLRERAERVRERVRAAEPEPVPEPVPVRSTPPRRSRRHALRERDEEPEYDEAIIYQLPDVSTDDVSTPPLGFPPAEFGPQGPEDEQAQTTRVTLDPVDPPGRS